LLASLYFYLSWKVQYGILLVVATLVGYYGASLIDKYKDRFVRKAILIFSLGIVLGVLVLFKYFNFFMSSFGYFSEAIGIKTSSMTLDVILPIGISFYTFQVISYLFDVYNGKVHPETKVIPFATFVTFFPQLVAGPIERASNIIPQLKRKVDFDYFRVTGGLKLMTWGFFKKVVIADRIGPMVDTVYNNPYAFEGLPIIIATVLFSFQIYCDFSGYSDIAIGGAKIFGIDLMKNFDRPYHSASIQEFWRRWHISLSSWFRDYIYIPLGGKRVSLKRWNINIIVTFIITGLWHGANWTFVLWGLIHGVYMIVGRFTLNARTFLMDIFRIRRESNIARYLGIMITYSLVTFAWIFFRANSLQDAYYILSHAFVNPISMLDILAIKSALVDIGFDRYTFAITVASILIMEAVHVMQAHVSIDKELSVRPFWVRWAVYYASIISILTFGVFERREFIYFQF